MITFQQYHFPPFCAIVWFLLICLKCQLHDRLVTIISQNNSEYNDNNARLRVIRILNLGWKILARAAYFPDWTDESTLIQVDIALFNRTLSKCCRNTKMTQLSFFDGIRNLTESHTNWRKIFRL